MKSIIKNIGFNYFTTSFEKPREINEYDKVNYIVFHQDVLDEIQSNCLPKANGSEFQFHYWALQVKISAQDGRRFAFTFPLAFFNFPQKVSGASVDFNLPEVDAEAQKVKEPAKNLAKKLIKVFPKNFFMERGFGVKFEFGDIGSIHRHPGRFGFSTIDLRFDPTKPGVIFRNKEGHDLWQTDSVLYCANNAELITTETRVFNISPVDPNDEDKGSIGTVAEIPTLMIMLGGKPENQVNDFSDFFGAKKEKEEINFIIKKTMHAPEIDEALELIKALGRTYKPLNFVDPEKIKQKSFGGYFGNSYSYSKNLIYSDWDVDEHTFDSDESDGEIKIKTNLKIKIDEKNLQTELLELCEISDIEQFDENALWDLAKNKNKRLDLFDIYNYYGVNDKLKISIGSGKLILDQDRIRFFIGNTMMFSDQWGI